MLLVEDDALIRTATAEALRDGGHVVIEAASAEEAMATLQTARVEVLVTDIHLPGTSGIELAQRAEAIRPGIRVVVASGDTGGVAPRLPGALLLTKPYNAERLLAAVRGGVPGRTV